MEPAQRANRRSTLIIVLLALGVVAGAGVWFFLSPPHHWPWQAKPSVPAPTHAELLKRAIYEFPWAIARTRPAHDDTDSGPGHVPAAYDHLAKRVGIPVDVLKRDLESAAQRILDDGSSTALERAGDLFATRKLLESLVAVETAITEARKTPFAGTPPTPLATALLLKAMGNRGPRQPEDLSRYERSLGPLDECLQLLDREKDVEWWLAVQHERADSLERLSRHAEVAVAYEEIQETASRVLGPEHPSTIDVLDQISDVHARRGNFGAAKKPVERALAAKEKAFGPDHPETIERASRLAVVHQKAGEFAEAEVLLRRVVAGYEKSGGREHEKSLLAMQALAGVLRVKGWMDEAEILLKQVVAAREKLHGPKDRQTLAAILQLSEFLLAAHRGLRAEGLLRTGLANAVESLGRQNALTQRYMIVLGRLLTDKGDLAEAERHLNEAVALAEQRGTDHPDTVFPLQILARLWTRRGEPRKAATLLEQALTTADRRMGPRHRDTLEVLVQYANFRRDHRPGPDVAKLYARALDGFERELGAMHLDTLNVAREYGLLQITLKDAGAAEPLLRRAVDGRKALLGAEHLLTLEATNDLTNALLAKGQYAEAEALGRQALEILERSFPGHPAMLDVLRSLALILAEQGSREADLFHRRHIDAVRLQFGDDETLTALAMAKYAEYLRKLGETARAIDYMRKSFRIFESRLGPGAKLTEDSRTFLRDLGAHP